MKQSHLKFLILSMLIAGAGLDAAAGNNAKTRQLTPVQQDERGFLDQLDIQQIERQPPDVDKSRNMDTTHGDQSIDPESEQDTIRDLEKELSRNQPSDDSHERDRLHKIR